MRADDASMLLEVFCIVAERQAFLFAYPCLAASASAPEGGPIVLAEISFSGHSSGTISVALPEKLCAEIMSNTLGVEEGGGFAEGQGGDALAELVNVLCGQFLTSVEGDKPLFNLSIPAIRRIVPKEWDDMRKSPGCRAATIDESPVLLNLNVL